MKRELQTAIPSAHIRDRAEVYRLRPFERADFAVVRRRFAEFLAPNVILDDERLNVDLGRLLDPSAECAYWIIEHGHDVVALAFGPHRPNAAGDIEAVVWLIGKPSIDSALIQVSKSIQKILHWAPFDFCRAKGWLLTRASATGCNPSSETRMCALKSAVHE